MPQEVLKEEKDARTELEKRLSETETQLRNQRPVPVQQVRNHDFTIVVLSAARLL